MDDALRAPGRLPWKSLTTFPPRAPSPTSSTELGPIFIKYSKVKTNPVLGHPTSTGKAPLNKPVLLSKQPGPPLSPELNPEERLNADLKHAIGSKVPVRTKAKLKTAATNHMLDLEKSPERVKSFFQDPRVKYAA